MLTSCRVTLLFITSLSGTITQVPTAAMKPWGSLKDMQGPVPKKNPLATVDPVNYVGWPTSFQKQTFYMLLDLEVKTKSPQISRHHFQSSPRHGTISNQANSFHFLSYKILFVMKLWTFFLHSDGPKKQPGDDSTVGGKNLSTVSFLMTPVAP